MHQKVEALLRRVSPRYVLAAAAVAAILATAAIGTNLSAAAAEPVVTEGWVLSVNGVAVAGAETEEALSQAYEALVDSYETEHTTCVEVLDLVEIAEGGITASLPQGEDVAGALARAITVRTEEHLVDTQTITVEAVVVEDDTMYEGKYTAEAGHDGQQVTETTVIRLNGREFLRKQEATVVTEQAVPTVLTVGTRERPEYIWPTHGAFTGSYGIDTVNGAHRTHKGIDIAASKGTDIVAARAGTVVYAGWDGGGFGNLVIIEHDNGTHTYYAHNSAILVSVGQFVAQGEHIAEMGSTGRSSGCHCHFEIRSGNYAGKYISPTVNPMDYLDRDDL